MLARIITKQLKLKSITGLKLPLSRFGTVSHKDAHDAHDSHGSHDAHDSHDSHDSHHHHDYSVHIDKSATWIKFPTSRRMVCVTGITDTHYQMKDPESSDPYTHLKQNPFYSLQNLAYNDPYYHEDEHQALVNAPHGYAEGSDPIDTRYDLIVPSVFVVGSLMLTLWAVLASNETPTMEGILFREKLAIEYVEGNLQKKNDQLNDLKEQIKLKSTQ